MDNIDEISSDCPSNNSVKEVDRDAFYAIPILKRMGDNSHFRVISVLILGLDFLKTFPGTCKRNFVCLQMISFEFLKAASIG